MRGRVLPTLVLAALAAGAGACKGTTPSGTAPPAPQQTSGVSTTSQRGSNLLSGDEIRELRVADALLGIQRLRPGWLRRRFERDEEGTTEAIVYINDIRAGGPAVLRQVRASDVVSIQFIPAIQARSRWGAGHGQGVIYVVSR